jgi:hypothetical protein
VLTPVVYCFEIRIVLKSFHAAVRCECAKPCTAVFCNANGITVLAHQFITRESPILFLTLVRSTTAALLSTSSQLERPSSHFSLFCDVTSLLLTAALCCVIAQRVVVISHRRFGTRYRSRLNGSKKKKRKKKKASNPSARFI